MQHSCCRHLQFIMSLCVFAIANAHLCLFLLNCLLQVSSDGVVDMDGISEYLASDQPKKDSMVQWCGSLFSLGRNLDVVTLCKALQEMHVKHKCHFMAQFLWHTARPLVCVCVCVFVSHLMFLL